MKKAFITKSGSHCKKGETNYFKNYRGTGEKRGVAESNCPTNKVICQFQFTWCLRGLFSTHFKILNLNKKIFSSNKLQQNLKQTNFDCHHSE